MTDGKIYPEVAPSQQILLPYSGMQQSVPSNNQNSGQQSTEGCTIHPMVTAYPAQYQSAPGTYQPVPQHDNVQVSSVVSPSGLCFH